jgi:hypothetical protein
MWMTILLACGTDSSVESTRQPGDTVEKTELGVVDDQVSDDQIIATPSAERQTEESTLVEGVVYFAKEPTCITDCVVKVTRSVQKWTPQDALNALYLGPTGEEAGMRLISCESTGASVQSIENGIAKVQLKGGCGGCGTLGLSELLIPTLKAFPEIFTVQIFDPSGKSQMENARMDSRPACLEP